MSVFTIAAAHAGIPIFIGFVCGRMVNETDVVQASRTRGFTQSTGYKVTTGAGLISGILGVLAGNPAYAVLDGGAALVPKGDHRVDVRYAELTPMRELRAEAKVNPHPLPKSITDQKLIASMEPVCRDWRSLR